MKGLLNFFIKDKMITLLPLSRCRGTLWRCKKKRPKS